MISQFPSLAASQQTRCHGIRHHEAGPWRGIYVVGTVLVLYLDVFVLVVQLFRRIPALLVSAPTQSEPLFVVTQLLVMAFADP